jgi:hypothetical protein
VQFVRLDASISNAESDQLRAELGSAMTAIQVTPLSFTELPTELRYTAQRTFRNSTHR